MKPQVICATVAPPSTTPFISIEEVAKRLCADVAWVREKVRRRSPNPMPCLNLGRHLVFEWEKVLEWARNSQRPKHTAHRRRKRAA